MGSHKDNTCCLPIEKSIHRLESVFLFVSTVLDHGDLGVIAVVRGPFHKGFTTFTRWIRHFLHRNRMCGTRILHSVERVKGR